jgi:hypothetical protein
MRRLLVLTLVCALAALPLTAASPLGGVTVSGDVWTNQAALPSGSSVYAGDEIRTAPGALAVLSSPATGRVELRGATRATVDAKTIALEQGVVASQRMAVQFDDLEIAARDAQADNWFVVENNAGRRLIAAYRGDVVIRGGSAGSFVVPAGHYAMAAAAAPAPRQAAPRGDDDKKEDDDDDKRAGGAAGAASKSGWSLGSLSHGASVAVVTGATAAALGGAVAGGAFREDSASPQD